MLLKAIIFTTFLVLSFALSIPAQMPMMGGWQTHMRGMVPFGPLHFGILAWQRELGLTPEQVDKLLSIRSEFLREAIPKSSAIRLAELELQDLLRADKVDLSRVEAKVREIGSLRVEARLTRIKALERAKEVLTPEQLRRWRELTLRFRRPFS